MGTSKFLAALLLTGCSLLADSSLQYLKCPEGKGCLTGYTCRYGECVQDASQEEGDVCSLDVQCKAGLSCPPGVPFCSRPCARIYDKNSECKEDQVCVPVSDHANPGKFTGGACVQSECNEDVDCQRDDLIFAAPNPANGCIRLARKGGLCLLRCQVGKRVADGVSGGPDACVSDRRFNPTHCGRVPSDDLICVPAGNLLEGNKCTLYPQSTSMPPDTCGINAGGLPLACLDKDGQVAGNVRCRVAACTSAADCPENQMCVTNLGVSYCRGATEN